MTVEVNGNSISGNSISGGIACIVCGSTGKFSCGRCKQPKYCSKQCQVSDWTLHKDPCKIFIAKRDQRNYNIFKSITDALKQISGDCIIAYAHYNSDVNVVINETIDEFIIRDRFHFASIEQSIEQSKPALVRASTDEEFVIVDDASVANGNNNTSKKINIHMKFTNYTHTMQIDKPDDIACIKSKHKIPSDGYTVYFEQ